jgi:hypothetical protein
MGFVPHERGYRPFRSDYSPGSKTADMRPFPLLALAALLASASASAQSTIPLNGIGQTDGPNARAVQRPAGPNAQAARRPAGPNGALARESRLLGKAEPYYPSCGAAGTARAAPIRRGEPGYGRHLDEDGDGVACE